VAICAIVGCVIFVIRHRPPATAAPIELPPAEVAAPPIIPPGARDTVSEAPAEAPEPTTAKSTTPTTPVVAHAVQTPTPTPAAAPKPPNRCVPPYDLDATGKKHWKLDCL
jgi:serine/threonine-protein kinase